MCHHALDFIVPTFYEGDLVFNACARVCMYVCQNCSSSPGSPINEARGSHINTHTHTLSQKLLHMHVCMCAPLEGHCSNLALRVQSPDTQQRFHLVFWPASFFAPCLIKAPSMGNTSVLAFHVIGLQLAA